MSSPLRTVVKVALLTVAACAAAGLARAAAKQRRRAGVLAAIDPRVARRTMSAEEDYVRPAGPRAMRDRYRRWDEVDESSDESFPASDPSAKY